MKLKNLTITTLQIAGFTSIICLTILALFISLVGIINANHKLEEVSETKLQTEHNLLLIKDGIADIENGEHSLLIEYYPAIGFHEDIFKHAEFNFKDINSACKILEHSKLSAEERNLWDPFSQNLTGWIKAERKFYTSQYEKDSILKANYKPGYKTRAIIAKYQKTALEESLRLLPLFTKVEETLNKLLNYYNNQTSKLAIQKNPLIRYYILYSLIIISALVIAVFITIVIAKKIKGNVLKIIHAGRKISEGDFTVSLDETEENELGSIKSVINEINFSITAMLKNITAMYDEQKSGNTLSRCRLSGLSGTFLEAVNKINESLDTIQKPSEETEKSIYNTFNSVTAMSKEQKAGNLGVRCDLTGFSGTYLELLTEVNNALDSISNPLFEAINLLDEYADGHFNRQNERPSRRPGKIN